MGIWPLTLYQYGWDGSGRIEAASQSAEAKGRTSAPGLDVDTAYGQLLRRMPEEDEPATRYAIVVPTEAQRTAERVPRRCGGCCGSTVT
ncbi:MAG: hypothetical protein ACRDS9_14420 [Pseudonocardiaceae bacterium]